jgi:hypothetical protein
VAERRKIEDQIVKIRAIPRRSKAPRLPEPLEGFVVKIAGRIDRKVDSDKLQELAAEHGLTEHLSRLFRWKPEISMAAVEGCRRVNHQGAAPVPSRPSLAARRSRSN